MDTGVEFAVVIGMAGAFYRAGTGVFTTNSSQKDAPLVVGSRRSFGMSLG